jgi:hypothetical protein
MNLMLRAPLSVANIDGKVNKGMTLYDYLVT